MVSTQSSNDWLIKKTLVYDRSLHERKKLVWSPWWWNFIRVGIPLLILWGILGIYVPVVLQQVRYQARMTMIHFQQVLPRGSLMPTWSWEILPSWVGDYALEVPKLGIQESVVESVDTQDKSSYMLALTKGVAHAMGSGSPGSLGTQYYFAHSSGLPFWGIRAVTFATLNKLVNGDEIFIYKDGQKHVYTVTDKQIVDPDDVRLLTITGNTERVVLQTCWPLGTNWKRLLVIAVKA